MARGKGSYYPLPMNFGWVPNGWVPNGFWFPTIIIVFQATGKEAAKPPNFVTRSGHEIFTGYNTVLELPLNEITIELPYVGQTQGEYTLSGLGDAPGRAAGRSTM